MIYKCYNMICVDSGNPCVETPIEGSSSGTSRPYFLSRNVDADTCNSKNKKRKKVKLYLHCFNVLCMHIHCSFEWI